MKVETFAFQLLAKSKLVCSLFAILVVLYLSQFLYISCFLQGVRVRACSKRQSLGESKLAELLLLSQKVHVWAPEELCSSEWLIFVCESRLDLYPGHTAFDKE